jgi:hypothetical protein
MIQLFLALGFLAACSGPPPPQKVFVPGPHVNTTISISVSATRVAVNEPVFLFATRRTEGYIEVPYGDLPEGVRWWRKMPPAYEKEVAANLRWIAKQEGSARFNTDFRKDLTREVRFTEPGTYELYALSSTFSPEPVTSETLTIEVTE